ncbi:MAG TPA: hypothetical protein VEB43_15515 [Anaeromyxobacter sp.]|nr:hypothetical protein [Anaeromyxobacter sp.]
MSPRQGGPSQSDEAAIQRYRYLVQTAPPDAIERAHEEAFAQLTPEQRREVLRSLSASVPSYERAGATAEDPRSLARLATRAELRQPGTIERSLGAGGFFAGSLLSSLAGAFIGTAIAQHFLGGFGPAEDAGGTADEQAAGADEGGDEPGVQEASDESGDFDSGADFGGDDFGADI